MLVENRIQTSYREAESCPAANGEILDVTGFDRYFHLFCIYIDVYLPQNNDKDWNALKIF